MRRIALFVAWAMLIGTSAAIAQPVGERVLTFTPTDLVGPQVAQSYGDTLSAERDVLWDVVVPNSLKEGDRAGVLIYISPQNRGQIPSHWEAVVERQNLIWISPRNMGNRIPLKRRMLATVLALGALQSEGYKIDASRVYVSGYSGGGRAASLVATAFPATFKGAIYFCGVNMWTTGDQNLLEQIKQNRFVFVTGKNDFNRGDTKQVYANYQREGVEAIKLMDISYLGHSLPRAKEFEEAIEFLDRD